MGKVQGKTASRLEDSTGRAPGPYSKNLSTPQIPTLVCMTRRLQDPGTPLHFRLHQGSRVAAVTKRKSSSPPLAVRASATTSPVWGLQGFHEGLGKSFLQNFPPHTETCGLDVGCALNLERVGLGSLSIFGRSRLCLGCPCKNPATSTRGLSCGSQLLGSYHQDS